MKENNCHYLNEQKTHIQIVTCEIIFEMNQKGDSLNLKLSGEMHKLNMNIQDAMKKQLTLN